MHTTHILSLSTLCLLHAPTLTRSTSDYSFYLEEHRFDWNNLNDWDARDCSLTELLPKSHTKLCVSRSSHDSASRFTRR